MFAQFFYATFGIMVGLILSCILGLIALYFIANKIEKKKRPLADRAFAIQESMQDIIEKRAITENNFVKNRSFGRVGLEATSASISSAVGHWMKRRLSTLRAFQTIGVTLLEDMSQASLVVGEVLFEVFNGVSHV